MEVIENKEKYQVETDLVGLAESLSSEDRAKEAEIRPRLLKAWAGFKLSRFECGKALDEYRALYKAEKRVKGELTRFDQVLEALGCGRAQGYRLIASYVQAMRVPDAIRLIAEVRGIDLGEGKNAGLVRQLIQRKIGDESVEQFLDRCIRAAEVARGSKAPTVKKESGPIPVPASKRNPADRKAELIALYRSHYVSEAEADRVIDDIIVAALEAQLSRLPGAIVTVSEAA
jgi:hypothetical protein